MDIQITVNSFRKQGAQSVQNGIEYHWYGGEKKIYIYSSVWKYFRRWITSTYPRGVSPRQNEKRATSVPLKRSAVPVALEAPHVPVARGKDAHSSLTFADICSIAAPAAATRAGQRHRARPHDRYISVAISLPPRRIRAIPLSCAATGATRSTTNALPTRYVYSPSRLQRVLTRGALHAPLAACLFYLALSREPARKECTYASKACVCVCTYART